MHNFTDGVALGAVFADPNGALALSKFVAILLHEVPHELADFAILMQAGMSKGAAITTQFATALAAFSGTAMGYYGASLSHQTGDAMNAVMAGGFLYLAATIGNAGGGQGQGQRQRQGQTATIQMALEAVAFGTGVAVMVAVAFAEEL